MAWGSFGLHESKQPKLIQSPLVRRSSRPMVPRGRSAHKYVHNRLNRYTNRLYDVYTNMYTYGVYEYIHISDRLVDR